MGPLVQLGHRACVGTRRRGAWKTGQGLERQAEEPLRGHRVCVGTRGAGSVGPRRRVHRPRCARTCWAGGLRGWACSSQRQETRSRRDWLGQEADEESASRCAHLSLVGTVRSGAKRRFWEVLEERLGEGHLGSAGMGQKAEVLGGVDVARGL